MTSSAGQGPYGPRRRLSFEWLESAKGCEPPCRRLGSSQNLWYARYSLIPDDERHLAQTRWHGFDRDVRG